MVMLCLIVCLCVDGIYEKAEAKKQERESIVRFGSVVSRKPHLITSNTTGAMSEARTVERSM